IETHTGCVEVVNFIMLGENPERHEDRQQHADGQHIIDEHRGEKEQVLGHLRHGDFVLGDVADELEKLVDLGQEDEAGQHQDEVEKKLRQDVGVDQLRKERKATTL